ncbi:hypothetical protein HY768_08915 [candidate division TA06 bacterium]|uniref:Uncharacterized protein n=1 Tax=candidate division TA06 bacterium TaxID=2250710 RepID=A0A933MKT4_UNCT6|nr:hypothetical protein [candidate division TA06 bacterium]
MSEPENKNDLKAAPRKNAWEEARLLARDIGLLVENNRRIAQNPKLSGCCLNIAYIGLPHLKTKAIALGRLLDLWSENKWTETCPACGEKVYILGAGGGALSGRQGWWGVCGHCQGVLSGNKEKFYQLYSEFAGIQPAQTGTGHIDLSDLLVELRAA